MSLSSTLIYTSELVPCSTICVPSATRHNIHMYPYFVFAAIHHLKSSPTLSNPEVVGSIPTEVSGLFMGLSSTLTYTSELFLCSTIWIRH